jgi:hypothetical protein
VLSLVIGLSEMRIHAIIELLHLGLQRLLKVGLTLPVWQLNYPYKRNQCALAAQVPDVKTAARFFRRCCGRYGA